MERVSRQDRPHPGATFRQIWYARLALAWESLWPALWPFVAVLGGFLALALFDILPALPGMAHLAVLGLLALALAFALFRAVRVWRLPRYAAARRRIELASGTAHRPLATLDDSLASESDPVGRALWEAHRARAAAATRAWRIGWPRPGLAGRDPRALRALLVLVLTVAAVSAGSDAWPRLVRAVAPGNALPLTPPGVLDLWITPPAYTGVAPILPRVVVGGEGPELQVPAGSTLLAQVTGGRGVPQLMVDERPTAFEPVDDRAFRHSGTLGYGTRLTVRQGSTTLGAWPMRIIPDLPPTAELARPPAATMRQALRLEYRARDDYGIASVTGVIRRAERPAGVADETIDLPLPLSGPRLREAEGASFHDLTAHPWAGLPVTLRVQALDTANQAGTSEEVRFVLPERQFRHPVARAIVEQRKQLVSDPAGNRVPVSRALLAIGGDPGRFQEDIVVFLGLRMAAVRLLRSPGADTTAAVQQLLWDTALRIEDGNLSLAERDLRALQQRLQDALANNATDAEIERLIQELREAMDRYLRAMMEEAMRNPQDARQPMDRNAQRMERNDLQRMLEQARQMARTGAREAARDMLQRLQEMLENMRAQAQQQPGEGGEQGGEGQQMLQSLQDLMQRQQQLTDRSFRRSQQNRPGQGRPGQPNMNGRQPGQQGQQGQGDDMGEDAAEQEAVRGQLAEMMRQLGEMMGGEMPGGFERAERAMRDATDALGRGNAQRALRPQMDALDQLRAGARDLVQRMQDQFAQGEGEGEGQQGEMDRAEERDPAGRPLNSANGVGMDGRDVRIPAELDIQRSREILDELMRRAGERFRPRLERDYIDRLIKRF